MPEQHVSDRHAVEQFRAEVKDKIGVVFDGCNSMPLTRALTRRQCEDFLVECYAEVTQELADHRQIALSYEAQVEQQAQQIGALRAEQARLIAACLEIADGVEWMTCDGNIVAAHIREAIGRRDADD